MTAGRRGRRVLVLDHAKRAGEKIRVSGGGHCNFTNLHAASRHYLSDNPSFCQAALRAFTPDDFITLIKKHGIRYHEKKAGQMFCDGSAEQIVTLLLAECHRHAVQFGLPTTIHRVTAMDSGFQVESNRGSWRTASLVVALGGRSMPKLGATGLGYDLARRFGLQIIPMRPGLAPLTFAPDTLQTCQNLAGIALEGVVRCGATRFADDLLFTHRGLSGPAILQISSYWHTGSEVHIDLAPNTDVYTLLKSTKETQPKIALRTALSRLLPKRLAHHLVTLAGYDGRLAEIADSRLRQMADTVNQWRIIPSGTQGYQRAEVTVGGVDTRALDSKTMVCQNIHGLYFIGEVLDVTGWLGGFNLQWAWSSGHAAGLAV